MVWVTIAGLVAPMLVHFALEACKAGYSSSLNINVCCSVVLG